VSLTLVEQLKLTRIMLEKPLTIQLVVQGSRLKVNFSVSVHFQYQGTDYKQYFDVINLQNYDMILGMLFLYQHRVLVGLNSPCVVLGSNEPLKMKGAQVSVLESRAVTHQMCLVLWTWRKLADELMRRMHPRSVERLSRLEGYRQPSLSISCKVKTILMRRMNTSLL